MDLLMKRFIQGQWTKASNWAAILIFPRAPFPIKQRKTGHLVYYKRSDPGRPKRRYFMTATSNCTPAVVVG